jgi:SAM-dependent methyltransferase
MQHASSADQLPVHWHIDYPRPGFQLVVGSPLNLEGWAVFPDAPVDFVEVSVDGRTEFLGRLNKQRPDVSKALGISHGNDLVGFDLQLPLPSDLEHGEHQVTLRFEGVRCGRSGPVTLPFMVVADDENKAFSQRFSEIPQYLVAKVNRDLNEQVFTTIGNDVCRYIIEACPQATSAPAILDFGCGLGRVLAPMRMQCPQARFTGYDIDPLMLRWCWHLQGKAPWLALEHSTQRMGNASFDFVYAISVFTHLDVSTEHWLHEIARVLKPGGTAYLTYHDETLFESFAGGPNLPSTSKGATLKGVHVEGKGTAEGGAAMGTFYETAAWVALLSRYFHVESTVPRGLGGHQSYSVVRNDGRALVAPDAVPYLTHLEEQLFELREKAAVAY